MTRGDTAPDLAFLRPDGTPAPLSGFLDRPLLLVVFFRHLACILCNDHLGRVVAARRSFEAAGCSVLVVCQASPAELSRYVAKRPWGVPFVSDPGRAAYRAFGLDRAGWLAFARPRVLLGYFRGMLRGVLPILPYAGEDVLQLGGDFILDRNRRVVYAHPSVVPSDRPAVADLLAAVAGSSATG